MGKLSRLKRREDEKKSTMALIQRRGACRRGDAASFMTAPRTSAILGAKATVYTGILRYTRTEAGLTVAMGYEVAHEVARHGGDRREAI
jgi:hypothetical protein